MVSRSPSPTNSSTNSSTDSSIDSSNQNLIPETNSNLIKLEQAIKLKSNPGKNSIDKVNSLIDVYIANLTQYKDELKKKFIDEREAKRDTVEIQTTINSIDIALLKNKKTGGKPGNRQKKSRRNTMRRKSKKTRKSKTKSKRSN